MRGRGRRGARGIASNQPTELAIANINSSHRIKHSTRVASFVFCSSFSHFTELPIFFYSLLLLFRRHERAKLCSKWPPSPRPSLRNVVLLVYSAHLVFVRSTLLFAAIFISCVFPLIVVAAAAARGVRRSNMCNRRGSLV